MPGSNSTQQEETLANLDRRNLLQAGLTTAAAGAVAQAADGPALAQSSGVDNIIRPHCAFMAAVQRCRVNVPTRPPR
jgi:hypothetical protein